MLGNNQIGFNIWHLPSITFLLTYISSTPISVDWALSWLLNKINRIAWQKKKKKKKIKHSSVCLSLGCATLGVQIRNMPSLHWKCDLDANFAHDRGLLFKDFALICSHCRGRDNLDSPIRPPQHHHHHNRRRQGAENIKCPPPQQVGQLHGNLQNHQSNFFPKILLFCMCLNFQQQSKMGGKWS